jgi:hydrocephalus-inducing protein
MSAQKLTGRMPVFSHSETVKFCQCRYSKDFQITNTSEIPLQFTWRVENGDRTHKEFNIIPERGAVLPGHTQTILVEFISEDICRYNSTLIMDVPNVQERLVVVPIDAECAVPLLQLQSNVLDFGDCFLNYPYTFELTLINSAKLPAKFVVEQQDAISKSLAGYTVTPHKGGIPAQGAPARQMPRGRSLSRTFITSDAY